MALLAAVWLGGCGYTLQTSKSELVEREGIRKIYIKPVANNTLKVGVENVVYNALLRNIASQTDVRIVQNETDADARVEATIWDVRATVSASAPAGAVGSFSDYASIQVATEYSASLVCQFQLFKLADRKGPTRLLWGSYFTRQKLFPAFFALGVPGTTAPLITESEYYRTIGDIASSMMDDVHESMFAMF